MTGLPNVDDDSEYISQVYHYFLVQLIIFLTDIYSHKVIEYYSSMVQYIADLVEGGIYYFVDNPIGCFIYVSEESITYMCFKGIKIYIQWK